MNEALPSLSARGRWILALVFVAILLAPVVAYWHYIGRGPAVDWREAQEQVERNGAVYVWVDSAPVPAELGEVISWPLASLRRARTLAEVPVGLQNRTLLLVCPGGVKNGIAARHLSRLGVRTVMVRGGYQARASDLQSRDYAFRVSPLHEQALIVLTFFGVKLVYSLLAAAIAAVLWQRRERDLAALRRAMVWFFIGEAFCFINVMLFHDRSLLSEHTHSAAMVLSLAYFAYALMAAIDDRLLHLSGVSPGMAHSPCMAHSLCGVCTREGPGGCRLRKLMLLLIPAAALVAAVPLTSPYRDAAYTTQVFRALHTYMHPVVHQVYELRYLPLVAIALLVAAWVSLLRPRRDFALPQILLAAATGAMGFSFFRFILVAPFEQNLVWYAAWEEITELLYIAGVGAMLLVFRRTLLQPAPSTAEPLRATTASPA
jgi:rhodanese-related sulfurtransferase